MTKKNNIQPHTQDLFISVPTAKCITSGFQQKITDILKSQKILQSEETKQAQQSELIYDSDLGISEWK